MRESLRVQVRATLATTLPLVARRAHAHPYRPTRRRGDLNRLLPPLLLCAAMVLAAASPRSPALGSTRSAATVATTHPMRYHVSLPSGWSSKREWPVVVAIPDAGRHFAENLNAFAKERGERP